MGARLRRDGGGVRDVRDRGLQRRTDEPRAGVHQLRAHPAATRRAGAGGRVSPGVLLLLPHGVAGAREEGDGRQHGAAARRGGLTPGGATVCHF